MDTSAPTAYGSSPPARLSGSSPTSHPSSRTSESRFDAGTIVGERYRIVSLLGRGGMGEVYRADDLTLGMPVALKFLPLEMAQDPLRLERFFDEVRVARQVSHPNVCRVYDLGQVNGEHFLSMELIHGEDLNGLLKKVGRFPQDKALDIARQLCAGLAAAHKKGVIHRDLKPANILLDGTGQVHIADFGLAALADSLGPDDVIAGTPTYMAPEQLAGQEVTARSDIYSLGLVLHELFTGRPLFQPSTLAELKKLHKSSTASSLSNQLPDIDPLVDRVILRCLNRDPSQRPGSPLEIAAALPGGDPLAAALAAGETPSPEMVAAAGSDGTLSAPIAAVLAAGALLLFLLGALTGIKTSIFGIYSWEKPPSFLAERGKEILHRIAPDQETLDSDWGIQMTWSYLSSQVRSHEAADRWEELRRGDVSIGRVWYRASPERLEPFPGFASVAPTDPPQVESGDALVVLDDRGRLREYSRVPPSFDDQDQIFAEVDWTPLLEEAELAVDELRTATPSWTPPMNTDLRAAWETADWADPSKTLHVEAGAWRGQLVYFRIIDPWVEPTASSNRSDSIGERLRRAGDLLLQIGLVLGGALLARRNIRLGRSDAAGAFRVAFGFLAIHTVVWALWAHHAPLAELQAEWDIFMLDAGYNLTLAASLWIFYVGLEPFVRRRWPESLIAWTRLLNGRFRDPLIGRDILFGAICGSLICLLVRLSAVAPIWLGEPPPRPRGSYLAANLGDSIAWFLDKPVHSLMSIMQALLLIVVLSLAVRNRTLAAVLAGLVFVGLSMSGVVHFWISVPIIVLAVGVMLWLLLRHGLLAATVANTLLTLQAMLPVSKDLDAWHQTTTHVVIVGLGLTLLWAFRVASGGQKMLRDQPSG